MSAQSQTQDKQYERYGNFLVNPIEIKGTKFKRSFIIESNKEATVFLSIVFKNTEESNKFQKNQFQIYNLLNHSSHPYTPKIKYYNSLKINGEQSGIFMGLSDIKGINLYNSPFIRNSASMPISSIFNIFLQITSAVVHFHSLGIIINELTMGKIFFTDIDYKKIIFADLLSAKIVQNDNFINPGKALVCDKDEGIKYILERSAYVAPEMLKYNAYDAFAANVYSLGVILFVMIFGHYPIISNDAKEMTQKIIKGDINWSKSIPIKVEELLKSMLNMDPSLRPSAVSILNIDWVQDIVNELGILGISEFKKNTPYRLTNNPTSFENVSDFKFTVETTKPAAQTTFTCPVCQHVFQRQAIMYSHMHSAHPQRGRGSKTLTKSDKK